MFSPEGRGNSVYTTFFPWKKEDFGFEFILPQLYYLLARRNPGPCGAIFEKGLGTKKLQEARAELIFHQCHHISGSHHYHGSLDSAYPCMNLMHPS
jgi:hypothetical protein